MSTLMFQDMTNDAFLLLTRSSMYARDQWDSTLASQGSGMLSSNAHHIDTREEIPAPLQPTFVKACLTTEELATGMLHNRN